MDNASSAEYTRALSDQMRALDAVLSATPDYFHLYDRSGRFLYVSPLTLQALGRTDDEVIGQTWRQLGLPPAVGEDFDRRLAAVLETGQAHTVEISLASEFGPRQLEESLSPVRDATGRIVVVVSTVRDVTERHQATERLAVLSEISSALASSLDLQTTLMSVARLVVPSLADYCLIDLLSEDQRIERVAVAHRDPRKHPLVEGLRRYPPDITMPTNPTARTLREGQAILFPELTSAMIAAVAHDDEHQRIMEALAPGSVITAPLRARDRNLGCLVLVMAESGRRYGPTERDLAEDVAHRAALAIDNARLYAIERRRAEELAVANQQAAQLVRAARALTASLDLGAVLEEIGQAAETLLDLDLCFVSLVDEAAGVLRYARIPKLFQRALADQRVPLNARSLTAEAVRRSAPVVVDDTLSSPLIDPVRRRLTNARAALAVPLPGRERVIGALLVIGTRAPRAFRAAEIVVAEALAAQAAVAIENARLYEVEQGARAEAQAAVRLREEFLGIASHELKTPLTIIKGYVQMLNRRAGQRELSAERLTSIYDALGRQIQRLEMLVSNLLDTARVQQGRLVLERRPADLVEIARQVVARFADSPERTEQHHLTLVAEGPVEGVWDSDRLDQVLTNLISNALKYSPTGGDVRVALRRVDGEAEVSVSDEGLGIPTDEQARLFQPFYRGTSHLAHGIQGVGLGLFISGRIIDRHGGRITLVSTPGAGTTFTIRLPLRGRPTATSHRP